MDLEKCGWLALACLMLSAAHADDTKRHSVLLSVQGDEHDNRQWLGKLALPLSDRAWVQGSLGRSAFAGAGARNTTNMGAALGVDGQALSSAVEFVRREGDARFEQHDWAAVVDWRGARGGLGADALLRSARGESSATQPGGVFGSPVTTTVRESVDCSAIGLHGHLNLTARAKVFAGAMHYRCDFNVEPAATSSSTPLSFLLGTNAGVSGAWRDQALIDRSYRVGGNYRFQHVTLSAQYFRDRIANADAILNTFQLQAGFPVSESWMLSPMIGYSSGESSGDAGYGGLSVGFNW